ncbi:MAG: UbiA family prenyltransferase [Planctomycetota bacterium]|jgi:1,4-dihydroxy-2-naphthoate octaprenyltransferase
MGLIRLIRYRFFFFAGLLPYFLGQAVAFNVQGKLEQLHFWLGLAGIFFVLVAVELFNEYFDAKEGGDRIFSQEEVSIPDSFFVFGLLALGLAFIFGLYLACKTGWLVLLFAFVGFLGTYFYVGPPIRWAYRGFGEIVIGLCYGPFMLLGSYYIQTQRIDFVPFFVSVISGLSVFCLAVLNEIPDYYQDMLVGKRNLVVRLGKTKAIMLLKLALPGVFILLCLGVLLASIPLSAMAAVLTVPWVLKSLRNVEKNYDNPMAFRFAVNTIVVTHVVLILSLGISFLRG